MSKYILLLLLLVNLPLMGQESPPPAILKAEIQELHSVVETLRAENLKLQQRNQQLMSDVLNLGNEIRALQERLDAASPVSSKTIEIPTETDTATVPKSTPHKVLYVNPNWHYMIVDCGSESGVKKNESGSVIRNGEIIASIKVTNVKPNQCVTEIDMTSFTERGLYPSVDDKVRFP